jgi:phosphotransferase system enzyme I (PtsI)
MAGDPMHALVLIGLGVTELSMNGPSVPLVKRVVRAAKASDARALALRLMELTTADDIEREVKAEMMRRFPGLVQTDSTSGPAGG